MSARITRSGGRGISAIFGKTVGKIRAGGAERPAAGWSSASLEAECGEQVPASGSFEVEGGAVEWSAVPERAG